MKHVKNKFVLGAAALLLAACNGSESVDQQTASIANERVRADARSSIDPDKIKLGRQLYLKNCTVCHGLNAEGAPDWQKPDAEGKYLPPPLNGTGHAWHHPQSALVDTIKNGTQRIGGNMPPWKDRLSDDEIALIILWFQSQWPDQLYEAWQRLDRESRQRQ